MKPSTLASLIELPVVSDPRGNLCFVESERQAPFPIARVYYLYDVPAGAVRAGHAHLALHQLLLPLSGSFDVRLNDGRVEEVVTLNRPNIGLHIGPMTWRELENFSSGSVCMVLASTPYDEADYIRDFDAFLARARG
jgi:dTDP-4-dehydrorhamnose 3,5-epimerase-like enzyme